MTSRLRKKRRTTVRNRKAAKKAISSLVAGLLVLFCGDVFAQDHPLKWRSAGTSTPAAAAPVQGKLQPLSALPSAGLSLNAPETNRGRASSDAPAPFIPAPTVREISAPKSVLVQTPAPRVSVPQASASTSGKHPTGWNKLKIDADVQPASHAGEVDAFDDPFQDRLAQYGNRPPQSRYVPRSSTGGGYQPPPDFNEPPVEQVPPARPQPPAFDAPVQLQPPAIQQIPDAPAAQPEEESIPPAPNQLRPRSQFPLPTDPDLERMEEEQPLTPRDPRNPGRRTTPRDPLGPMTDPDANPNLDFPPNRDPGETPPKGPEVEDRKKPSKDCDRVYNDRDCCEADDQCARARRFIRDSSIKNISLDITPRFRPDSPTWKEDYAFRDDKLKQSDSREWKDREGGTLARGRLIDLAQSKAVVREDNGQLRHLSFNELSEDDVCFLNAWWNLPTECIAGGQFQERAWVPATFAWTASALCHKPLYFEDVQLERYGHTAGPLLQPFFSGAHFFGNALIVPYRAGIHPPNECLYTLGYYRPGNCAPWVVPAFPLSVRGAAIETGLIVGGVFLIP